MHKEALWQPHLQDGSGSANNVTWLLLANSHQKSEPKSLVHQNSEQRIGIQKDMLNLGNTASPNLFFLGFKLTHRWSKDILEYNDLINIQVTHMRIPLSPNKDDG